MKKLILTVVTTLGFITLGFTQPCFPDGIALTSQAQIINFHLHYPNCTEIGGDLFIQGNDITNLYGLSVLTSIGGDLGILFNAFLKSLSGLDNITSIGEDVIIYHNDSLTSLSGFEGLTSIESYLIITGNDALTSIAELNNVTSTGAYIKIEENNALTSLTGLDNMDAASIDTLEIYSNSSLSTCDVKSVCDFLSSPNGIIEIHDNAPGCNNQVEVEEACLVSVPEANITIPVSVYPNPFSTSTTIEYQLDQPSDVTLIIFNHLGKQVDLIQQYQQSGKQSITWQPQGLPPGLYYFTLQAGEQVATGKMVMVQ